MKQDKENHYIILTSNYQCEFYMKAGDFDSETSLLTTVDSEHVVMRKKTGINDCEFIYLDGRHVIGQKYKFSGGLYDF